MNYKGDKCVYMYTFIIWPLQAPDMVHSLSLSVLTQFIADWNQSN